MVAIVFFKRVTCTLGGKYGKLMKISNAWEMKINQWWDDVTCNWKSPIQLLSLGTVYCLLSLFVGLPNRTGVLIEGVSFLDKFRQYRTWTLCEHGKVGRLCGKALYVLSGFWVCFEIKSTTTTETRGRMCRVSYYWGWLNLCCRLNLCADQWVSSAVRNFEECAIDWIECGKEFHMIADW